MKKLFLRFFIIILAIASLSSSVIAVSNSNVQPRYTYINQNHVDLIINTSTGKALCSASVGASGNTSIKVDGYLQQYTDGKWKTLVIWSKTNASVVGLTTSHNVESGYLYRYIVYFYVYDTCGNLIEQTSESKSVGYYV